MSYDVVLITDILPQALWARPIGAYRIATELRRHGYRTKVIFGLSDYEPETQIQLLLNSVDSNTKILGLSTTFMTDTIRFAGPIGIRNRFANDVVATVQRLKLRFPSLKIVSGGANAHRWPKSLVDLYVAGFGDRVLIDVLENKLSRDLLRVENGQTIFRAPAEGPVGNFETKYDASDLIFPEETVTLEISRGCRFRCKFCAYPLNGRKKNDYLKSKSDLRAEVVRNFEHHGLRKYILGDDTFNESDEKIEHVLDVFESLPFKIEWAAYFRLDLLVQQRRHWERLAKNGLRGTFFGIESLHDPSSRSIGKGLGEKRTVEALTELRRIWGDSVATQGGFIVGLPHETEDTFGNWRDKLLRPDFPLHVKTFQPLWIEASSPFYPWRSEFQANSQDYGYRLSGNGEQSSWSNDSWNSERASELANAANFKTVELGVQKSFGPFYNLMIMGYGLSFADAFALNAGDESHRLIEPLTAARMTKYLQRELSFAPGQNELKRRAL